MEMIAHQVHEVWIHWMKHMLPILEGPDKGLQIGRWKRQMKTDYNDLSDREKASDMEQAKKIYQAFEEYRMMMM